MISIETYQECLKESKAMQKLERIGDPLTDILPYEHDPQELDTIAKRRLKMWEYHADHYDRTGSWIYI